MSARECFEAGLAQVGSALGEIRKIEADLAKFEKSESELRIAAATKTDADLKALAGKIDSIDASQKSLGGGRILAIAQVKQSKLVLSSDGVSYDAATGLIAFPNPKKLPFIPVVSGSAEVTYITDTYWIKRVLGPDKFFVWSHALNTSGADGSSAPHDFTALVVGFEEPPKP